MDLPLTSTLQHWSHNLLFRLSLCLATGSRLHASFAFTLRNTITCEKRATQRIQTLCEHRFGQCSCSWFSRIRRYCGPDRWWASCHHPRKWFCRTLWAHTLWWGRAWPGSQTARARAECAWPARLGREARQDRVDRDVSEVVVESGLEVTVKEQAGAKTGETREGRRWVKREDMRTANNLSHACVSHAWECAKCKRIVCTPEKCACNRWVCVQLAVAHSSCYYVGANPTTKNQRTKNSPLHYHLERIPSDFLQGSFDLPHSDFVHQFAFHQSLDVWMLVGFPRHALLLILDDAFYVELKSEIRFSANCQFQLFVSVSKLVHLPVVVPGVSCRHLQWVAWILFDATRNCLLYEFSSRPSHSDCCPWVSLLHVLLVLVIPCSSNCDSLMKLGRSSTSAILISVFQELRKMSEFS